MEGASTIVVYGVAAVLPTVILMWLVYKQDKIEKEPIGLILRLALYGIPAALVSGLLESVIIKILGVIFPQGSFIYTVILCFLGVALVEEGSKYFFLKLGTWGHQEFNFSFDGIVYAVAVSLGFAAFENIGYIMGYGLEVAPSRAALAIPAHMAFSVFMGLFYGRGRGYFNRGNLPASKRSRFMALLIPILLHGFYDTCAMTYSDVATVVFFTFVVAMDIAMIITVKRESKRDVRI